MRWNHLHGFVVASRDGYGQRGSDLLWALFDDAEFDLLPIALEGACHSKTFDRIPIFPSAHGIDMRL